MGHGTLEMVTLATPAVDRVARAYRQVLGYQSVSRGTVSRDQANAWGTPSTTGRPFEVLRPESRSPVSVRIVEADPPAGGAEGLRRTLGWSALELTVRDVDRLHQRLLGEPEFEVIGPPTPLEGLLVIYPMQALGPAGEVVYLNEVRGSLPKHDLPRAQSEVDHVFIVVLGAPDLHAAEGFYCTAGFELADRYELAYRMINQAFDLSSDQRHRLATLGVGRTVCLEVDQYPELATPRRQAVGQLPLGMAMVSFQVESLDTLGVPFLGPWTSNGTLPYGGRRLAASRGTAGELVEWIEGPP